jgi:carboxyl-terminal processing protease
MEHKMKKWIFATFALSIGIIIGASVQPTYSGDNIYKQMDKFQTVFNTAYQNYVEDLEAPGMIEDAIEGMLEGLDVHSVYIPPEKKKAVDEDFKGHFHGIGIHFDVLEDSIVVITPLAGGPSEMLGIQAMDKIVKIDGETAVGIPRSDVPKRLKGEKGTLVTVDIFREGEDSLIHFEIIRDKIPQWSLDSRFMMDQTDIGYMKFNRFSATTHDEMMEAVTYLKSQGMQKLVLDLRGNPGGYLEQAFQMADDFLARGDTIVYTKGRKKHFDKVYKSRSDGLLQDIPLIVMVNQGSASASEIVSGAMQDLDRGIVAGVTSFGKGLVQRQYDLKDGSAFRVTISYYYTPSGRSIQRPYKDKDQYRKLVGRLEMEEGFHPDQSELIKMFQDQFEKDTLTDELKNIISYEDGEFNLDSLPIYNTRGGRTVFGGGGVTPDYIVKADTSRLTDFSVSLRRKRIVTVFADKWLSSGGESIKTKYLNNFIGFYRDWKPSDDAWESFRELVESKEIEWNEDEFEKDKPWLLTYIKADMANILWTRHESAKIWRTIDRQLKKSIKLFPEAKKLISVN